MDSLKKSCADLGFANIHTYIQSGNVVFRFKKTNLSKIETLIKNKISEDYGFDVPVIVKHAGDLYNVIKNNPFLSSKNVDLSMLHVTFLSAVPEKSGVNKLKEVDYSPDKFIVIDDIVYLYFPDGYGNTKLNNNFFENKLKVKATNRNWKTVNELCKIADSIGE
jgi:uncharacterized protein (DUF1697 family)